MMARLNNRSRIATFVEKKALFVKIIVVATKTTKSKKIRVRNGILDM